MRNLLSAQKIVAVRLRGGLALGVLLSAAALAGWLALLSEGKACSQDERCWQSGCAHHARQYRCKSRCWFYHFVPLTLLLFVALLLALRLLLPAALRGLPGVLVLGKSTVKQLVVHSGCPACPQAGHTG